MNYFNSALRRFAERRSLLLLVANLGSQVIALAVSPLLTRLYPPSSFGVLAAITSVVMILSPLSTGRIELRLPTIREDREAAGLLKLILCISGAYFFLFLASAILLPLVYGDGKPLFFDWLLFVPFGIFCIGAYDTLAIEAGRQDRLNALAVSKIQQTIFGNFGQILLGFLGFLNAGLLVGFVLNQTAGIHRLSRALLSSLRGMPSHSSAELWALLRENARFPLYSGWAASLDAGSKWCTPLALASIWDPAIAGFAFIGDRVIGRPLMVLSTSILPVFVADIGMALEDDASRARKIYVKCFIKQATAVVAWTTIVIVSAPTLIPFIFGDRWSTGVPYIQAVALAGAPFSALHAVVHTFSITKRQRLEAVLVSVKVALVVGVIICCFALGKSALYAIYSVAVIQFFIGAVTLFLHLKVLTTSKRR